MLVLGLFRLCSLYLGFRLFACILLFLFPARNLYATNLFVFAPLWLRLSGIALYRGLVAVVPVLAGIGLLALVLLAGLWLGLVVFVSYIKIPALWLVTICRIVLRSSRARYASIIFSVVVLLFRLRLLVLLVGSFCRSRSLVVLGRVLLPFCRRRLLSWLCA